MDDKTTLTKRLDGLAEVLTETTNFSSYAHTVYEAGAELDRQAKQIAMLREALGYCAGALEDLAGAAQAESLLRAFDALGEDYLKVKAELAAVRTGKELALFVAATEMERLEAELAAQATLVEPVALSAIAEWDTAPTMTKYGVGMMQAYIAISKDETLTLTCHRDALRLPSPLHTTTPPSEPDMVSVPREPTPEMIEAGVDDAGGGGSARDWVARVYRAMIGAAK